MLADIESGFVTMVVVKDMSRFGRNYLEVGMYTEIRFPEMGVRFVAINDGVDSDNPFDNDFTPFRNIINEWYAKDTSKKIRAVFRAKGMSGKRLSTHPPYGYLKDKEGNLSTDPETAPVVRLIFQLAAEGNGPGKIARCLREMKIIAPGTLEFERTGRKTRYDPEHPCHWSSNSIVNILENRAYLGHTVNFKTTKLSYKSKKRYRIHWKNRWFSRIPMRRWYRRKRGRLCRRTDKTAADLPASEIWGYFQVYYTVRTVAISSTSAVLKSYLVTKTIMFAVHIERANGCVRLIPYALLC